MRLWISTVIAATISGAAVLVYMRGQRPAPAASADSSTLADLRDEVALLNRRVGNAESTTNYLSNNLPHARAPLPDVEQAPQASSEPLPEHLPPPPTEAQQVARFEEHFANIDALRGKVEDLALDSQFTATLADTPPGLAVLKSASVDRVSCGNHFCRVELTFPERNTARQGQTELSIQLGPLISNFTAYMAPDGKHLNAYFSIGDQKLPAFPPLAQE